jgi:hypothetical protein
MIRGSGPRPDPESFAFSVLMNLQLNSWTALEKFKHDIFGGKPDPRHLWVDPFMFFTIFA